MKILITCLLTLTAAFSAQSNLAQNARPIKGVDKILFANDACRVFEKYVVVSQNLMSDKYKSGDVSEKVKVFKRLPGISPGQSCEKKGVLILAFESKEEVYDSAGNVLGDLIFIDLDYSPDTQKMLIFNGLTGKQIFAADHTGYHKPFYLGKNIFYFEDWAAKDGPASRCPQAQKWKKEGLFASWIQPYKLELGTMKKTTNGRSFCVAVH